ncbi:MAG: FtsW/RodA/SpoVE family cell cycle protein [Bacteroidales bacterium]|nr:FtsW/RodA/SpoVE family cell cycle protein [Bacteroidales bacterium]
MEGTAEKGTGIRRGFWNFIDSIKGDKVVWIIVFMLIMISILAVFSSTSLLAMGDDLDRLKIVREQLITAGLGISIIWLLCRIKRIGVFRILSQLGFAASVVLLTLLVAHVDMGVVCKAIITNDVYRALRIFGLQVHVFEFVKVAMVMYLAWAMDAYKKDLAAMTSNEKSTTFGLANSLSQHKKLAFLAKPFWKRMMYIYLPIITVCVLIMPGSNSSAIFVGGILIATLLVGGIPMKEIFIAAAGAVVCLLLIIGLYKATGWEALRRVDTMLSRIEADYSPAILEEVDENGRFVAPEGSTEFRRRLDKIQQPFGAKVAVHEGGLLGKGSGNSTQKYVVAVIYGDYMFSFIIEEYGIWGAFLVIILYVSLLARGSMIARLSDTEFAKVAVGGLSLLITGQAFMHMFVNVDIGPMTGQTLPLVSHGSSAFLMFSIAFGVILSISRMSREKIREEEEAAAPIYQREQDELQATLEDIERLEEI